MKRLSNRLFYHLLKLSLKGAACLPRASLTRLAPLLGGLWHGLDRRHRNIAGLNMASAFGGKPSEDRIRSMVRANFTQLARVALEIPSLLRLERENLASYVVFSGEENLQRALSGGRGILFLTAHLGNWELMALATSLRFGFPLTVVARPLDFAPLDRVFREVRSRTGNEVVDKDQSSNALRRKLANNEIIGILLDQNASWYSGVYVPFFNRIACTSKGLAMFALRYKAAVVPAFNIRQSDGRYRIMFEAAVSLSRTGDVKRDILENTARFNRIIEKYVRMAPDNWLWVHRRWRIKPVPEGVMNRPGLGTIPLPEGEKA